MKKIITAFILLTIIYSLYAQNTIEIYPLDKRRSTEVYVRKGDNIKIEVNGKWSLWDKYEQTDGEGHQFVANEYGNWGALLGKIGSSKPFYVGNGLEFTSEAEGILYLFPNKDKYKIEGQSGFLEATIYGGTSQENFINTSLNNSTHIKFDATEGYKTTDIYLESGDTLEIYSFGEWTMWNGVYPEISAEGHDFSADGVAWGKLYCGIGSSDGQYKEIFSVGERSTFTAKNSGIISFFPFTGNYKTEEQGALDIYIIGGRKASTQDISKINTEIRKELEEEVLTQINEIRKSAMLPEVISMDAFSQSSYNHAKYMVINNAFSRDEEARNAEFTGLTLTDRLKTLGYNDKSRELFCQTTSTKEAIDLFINTVYHRLRLLDPELKYIGYGSYRDKNKIIHVFDLGYKNSLDRKDQWDIILYPSNDVTEIKTNWNGLENPDPFPVGTNKPLGYPITIIFNDKINQVYESVLVDQSGKKIISFIITPQSDINNKQINAIVIVPKTPLARGTKYVASVIVSLGEEKNKETYTWSFYTEE